ncbi:MAG TPA: hypothetical protein VN709_04240 [Terriglobales bacterium]|nr:hypothetical protein [Terriglobales bacterium]
MKAKLLLFPAAALLTLAPMTQAQQPTSYRVQFFLSQVQNGKPAESRTYTLMVRDNAGGNRMEVGERVPIRAGTDKIDYENIGFELDCSIGNNATRTPVPEGEVALIMNASMSALAPSSTPLQPVIRRASTSANTLLRVGQRSLLSKFSDADGNSYQIEALVEPPSASER